MLCSCLTKWSGQRGAEAKQELVVLEEFEMGCRVGCALVFLWWKHHR